MVTPSSRPVAASSLISATSPYRQRISCWPLHCKRPAWGRQRLGNWASAHSPSVRLQFRPRLFQSIRLLLLVPGYRVCKACSPSWMKIGSPPPAPRAACPCCCRWRSTRPTTTCCPTGVEAGPGAFVLVPFGPQTRIGVVWDGAGRRGRQAGRRQEAQGHHRAAHRRAAAARHVAALCRVGGALHAGPARHGRAHDDGLARPCSSP